MDAIHEHSIKNVIRKIFYIEKKNLRNNKRKALKKKAKQDTKLLIFLSILYTTF